MLCRLTRTFRKANRVLPLRAGNSYRPSVEALEDRWLPSTFTWVNNVDGNFNDPSMWQDQNHNPGVPGPNDDAFVNFNAITITSPASSTVNSLHCNARLQVTGGTFAVNDVAVNTNVAQLVVNKGDTFQVLGGSASVTNGGTINGHLLVNPAATLFFTGGTTSLLAGTTWAGAGLYDVAGGAVSVNTPLNTPKNFEVDAGGVINGSSTLTVGKGSTFTWTGGDLDGMSTTAVAAGGTLVLTGSNTKSVTNLHTLANAGTMDWNGGAIGDGALVDNQAGGTLNITTPSSISGGTFNNEGLINVNDAAGSSTFFGGFNDTGTVDVQGGGVQIGLDGGTTSGTLKAEQGASLFFVEYLRDGSSYTLTSTAQLTGPGLFGYSPQFGGTVTANGSLSVQNFELDGGASLSGPGSLAVTGTFNWNGGSLGLATVTIPTGATLNLGPNESITSGTLDNSGTINQPGSSFGGSGTVDNQSGGVWNITAPASVSGGTAINEGLMTLTSPTSGVTFLGGFSESASGTVDVQSGGVQIGLDGGTTSGTLKAEQGASLFFVEYLHDGASYTLASTAQLAGPGLFGYSPQFGGSVTVNGGLSVQDFELDGGATLSGPGSLAVAGTFNWNGGSLGLATVTIPTGAALNLGGNENLSSGTLDNAGTVNEPGGSLGGGGTFDNQAGGVWNITAASGVNVGVVNEGNILTSDPSNASSYFGSFNESTQGKLDVLSGGVQIGLDGGTTSGTIQAESGASVVFVEGLHNGSSYTLASTAQLTGPGLFAYSPQFGGSVTVNGSLSVQNFELDSNSNLSGPGKLTVTGTFNWYGGSLSLVTTTVAKGAVLNLSVGNVSLASGTMTLAGTTNWNGNNSINISGGTSITNKGVFNVENDQSVGGGGVFNNSGLFTKINSTATTSVGVTVNNSGRIEVHGGTVNLNSGVDQVSGTSLVGGTWSVFGTTTQQATLDFTGYGNLTTIAATTTVKLSGPNSAFTNLAGLTGNSGTFELLGGQSFTTSGSFTNSGTLNLGPGSNLAVNGSFTQTSTGTLDVDIAGTKTKPTVSGITVAAGGTLTVGGTLNVTSKTTPPVGTTLTVGQNEGSSPVSGMFSGMPEGSTIVVNGATYKISYAGGSGNSVTLTRVS